MTKAASLVLVVLLSIGGCATTGGSSRGTDQLTRGFALRIGMSKRQVLEAFYEPPVMKDRLSDGRDRWHYCTTLSSHKENYVLFLMFEDEVLVATNSESFIAASGERFVDCKIFIRQGYSYRAAAVGTASGGSSVGAAMAAGAKAMSESIGSAADDPPGRSSTHCVPDGLGGYSCTTGDAAYGNERSTRCYPDGLGGFICEDAY